MRISEKEAREINRIFSDEIKFAYELKLFGSRTDDRKRGGDIDLLLIVGTENLQKAKSHKYQILDRLYDTLGEQKIDILIVTPQSLEADTFLKSIAEGSWIPL